MRLNLSVRFVVFQSMDGKVSLLDFKQIKSIFDRYNDDYNIYLYVQSVAEAIRYIIYSYIVLKYTN